MVNTPLTSAGYGLLVVLALLQLKRGNRRANRYLGALTLLVSISIIVHALNHPLLSFSTASFPFLYGPLLYFHIGALTNSSGNWSLKRLIQRHSFFFLALSAYQATSPSGVLERGYLWTPGDRTSYSILQNLHILAYLMISMRLIFQFSKVPQNPDAGFIGVQKGIHNWLHVIVGYSAFVTSLAAVQVLSPGSLTAWLLPALCSGFFLVTAYFWFLYPEIFISVLAQRAKYRKSGLRDEDIGRFEAKIRATLESERPYLNPNLTLKDLAEMLNINATYLSQILNERFNQSFFDFINGYRVRAARQKLDQLEKGRTILDVAYEVGFNSKSTFYAAFKKELGMTPGEFLKASADATENAVKNS